MLALREGPQWSPQPECQMLLPELEAHPRLKTASSGRGVCCVFSVCSSYTGVLLRGWWPAAVSPDCNSVRRSQGRRMTASPGLLRKRSAASALTSSVYWTSSTAYFSLKCSLEWILKRKHNESHGQGLATPQPGHLAPWLHAYHDERI